MKHSNTFALFALAGLLLGVTGCSYAPVTQTTHVTHPPDYTPLVVTAIVLIVLCALLAGLAYATQRNGASNASYEIVPQGGQRNAPLPLLTRANA